MRVQEFENAVWNVEGIRIVIRADKNDQVDSFTHTNRRNASDTVRQWLNDRVLPKLNGQDVSVIDDYGQLPRGNTHLGSVRGSYSS